jgi:hypothetical protein
VIQESQFSEIGVIEQVKTSKCNKGTCDKGGEIKEW